MRDLNPAQLVDSALLHYRAGRLGETEQLCRSVLARDPDHVDALNLLAVLKACGGDLLQALALLDRAIVVAPQVGTSHVNRGNILHQLARYDEALAAFHQAARF